MAEINIFFYSIIIKLTLVLILDICNFGQSKQFLASFSLVANRACKCLVLFQVNVLVSWSFTSFNVNDSDVILTFNHNMVECIDGLGDHLQVSSILQSNRMFSYSSGVWPIMDYKWSACLDICLQEIVSGNV